MIDDMTDDAQHQRVQQEMATMETWKPSSLTTGRVIRAEEVEARVTRLVAEIAEKDQRMANLLVERDRETDMRRTAEHHRDELAVVLEQHPYPDEYEDMKERAEAAEAERDALLAQVHRLTDQLGECYRESGADPDGNENWRLAPNAVREVKRLRQDYTEACNEVATLTAQQQAQREALETLISEWRRDAQELREATGGTWIEPGVREACADELADLLAASEPEK